MNYGHLGKIAVLASTSLRYFLVAGLAYFLFYRWKGNKWQRFKIQRASPKAGAIRTEVLYSLSTLVIFSVVIWALLFSPLKQYTRLYDHFSSHSTLYFFFSLLCSIFLHDTYFYWTHRLMHWKKIFRFAHHIHHKSHNPTPWAAYAFHPVEALVEVGILPLMVFLIPMHIAAVSLFGLYMIVLNVIGHLGFELYPRHFVRSRWLGWMNTSTHHNMHHKFSKCNYGLYFNIWDKIMGTNHKKYRETFEEAAAGAREREGNRNRSALYVPSGMKLPVEQEI